MNCKTAEIYMDALIDNELSVRECLEITEHIESCKDCKAKWELSESIKSKLKHYTESLKVPRELAKSIYNKYISEPQIINFKQVLVAASVAFLLGLGLFQYIKEPKLMELHNKTKPEIATNDVGLLSKHININIQKKKLVQFEKANFQIQGGTRIAKPFNKEISLIALKNDKGQKISLCFLPGSYKMSGCHKIEMNGMTFYCGKGENCSFAYWKQNGKTIALVSESLTDVEMIKMAMPLFGEV